MRAGIGVALLTILACACGNRDTLLLRDFDPRPTLKVPAHHPQRARFPAIDVHNHINDDRPGRSRADPAEIVKVLDAANVETVVNLTGGWGERLRRSIAELSVAHPGRFVVFTQIDYAHLSEPGYLVRQLRESVAAGARGVKVLKDLGLSVRDERGALIAIDDPRLDPVWEEAGALGVPVAFHTADPDAFFLPVDARNERYEELRTHPGWSFAPGRGFPSKPELLAARNRVIARHPRTQFVGLHVANHPEDLDEVARWLDTYPNLVVETGGRLAELGRQPRHARAFILAYQDRVLFGTDAFPSPAMYRRWFRFLETDDEYFPYADVPGDQGRWNVYALDLPDDVLRKVYHDNAARLLGLQR